MQRLSAILAIVSITLSSGCIGASRAPYESTGVPELQTHFEIAGRGEPVVFVHGFSQTHAAWKDTPVYIDLLRDYEVITVDLRGHGESVKPHDPEQYGLNMQADLTDLLDHLQIDKAHFIGFSLGASVVGDLVISSPERVQTATMGSGFFTTWDDSEEAFADQLGRRKPGGECQPWEPAEQDYQALAALIRGAKYAVVSDEQISSIESPTLMVFGSIELDQMNGARRNQIEKLPPAVSILIVEGADHDSSKAAILSPQFTRAVRRLIGRHSIH